MLLELLELNASSKSNKDNEPVDAKSCPTGNPLEPRSEAVFFRFSVVTLSETFTDSLGDSSIRSRVAPILFIVCATTLRPPT